MATNQEPDYSTYTLKELYSAFENINKDKYPARFEQLKAEIEKRKLENPTENHDLRRELESPGIYPSSLRRFFAFFIDTFAIGLLSWPLFAILNYFSNLSVLASSAQLIAYGLYFGFYDSSKSNSPSPGKKSMGIHLVDAQGKKLSFRKALLRSNFYNIALYLMIIVYSLSNPRPENGPSLQFMMAFTFVFTLLFGESVFQVFHPQKRTLLDVITNTFVLRAPETPKEPAKRFALIPTALAVTLLGLTLNGLSKCDFKPPQSPDLESVQSDLRSQLQNPKIYLTMMETTGSKEVQYFLHLAVHVAAEQVEDKAYRDDFMQQASKVLSKQTQNPAIKQVRFNFISQKYMGLVSLSHQSTVDLKVDGTSAEPASP